MARPTLSQYLNYLEQEPRTKGWGALLVYDRQRANRLLAQEFIARFDDSHWLKPINGTKETDSGIWTQMSDFKLGQPRLSFETANIGSSIATLSMPVVSGRLTEWRRSDNGQAELVGISHLDPLTAPQVRMQIKLNHADGVIDQDGRVLIDLSDGEAGTYTFEVSSWKDLNLKLGEFIKDEFGKLPDNERVWELNTIRRFEDGIDPTSFAVRTHSLARAGRSTPSLDAEEQEDGAILVGVAFNGEGNGDFPTRDQDMPFLLPESTDGEDYSLSVLLGNEAWMKNVLTEGLRQMPGYGGNNYEYERDDSKFITKVSTGHILLKGYQDYKLFNDNRNRINIDIFAMSGVASGEFNKGKIVFRWKGMAPLPYGFGFYVYINNGWEGGKMPLYGDIDLSCEFSAALDDEGCIVLTGGEVAGTVNLSTGDEEYDRDYIPHMLANFNQAARASFTPVLNAMKNISVTVDLLRLNSLLFRSEQVATPSLLELPGDVSLLGYLAPKHTAFAIDPLEKVLAADGTLQLRLDPQPAGAVTWSVKGLPGEEGDVGSVSDGLYQAPAAEQITGTVKRVIVTATVGDHSSSALLSVVPKAVAVRPNLLNAFYSTAEKPQRYVVEGGSIDASLQWAMSEDSLGTQRAPEPGDSDLDIPKDKNVRIYVAPEKPANREPGLAKLMHLDQLQVTGAGRTEIIDIPVAWVATPAFISLSKVGDGLKLVLSAEGEDGEVIFDPAETNWYTVKGTGSVDAATGIYTPGADEGDYVIIAGAAKNSPLISIWNYTVVPMPYTDAEAACTAQMRQLVRSRRF
ncbi:Ig-like domain-containing protein [Pseudomonas guariconensis]|uniref:Ig-like domain-containing protein n=1 Tax=Pseudomonas TaxID=286 RepID=UPI002096A24D|nr:MULTISPECIES: Ig-like domain-containing protein [Pseudomonas]MCO7514907.1 Ig-like domain-containing protein [Pseudomonas putida]MCO7594038.1 Ig-like domain-containing protein [Pseudomonas guariconensis]MCO7605242.1 Ig-like domain-containing protein [Pseudomonas guariconensis]MCO7630482.1 Ig-like domain-containing protein [Pseudomonas guariconensis]MCU7220234.1 Ig-like domain-containing protein [Pseudomonas brassicacearum]